MYTYIIIYGHQPKTRIYSYPIMQLFGKQKKDILQCHIRLCLICQCILILYYKSIHVKKW